MTEINPRAFLRVYDDDKEAFGHVYAPPDSISYDLPGLLGTPGASYIGFDRDPTGTYLMQQVVPVYLNAGPASWQQADGSALPPASFSSAKDPETGKLFLRHTSVTNPFNVFFAESPRVLDEGFSAEFYIAAATASSAGAVPAVSFYIEFSRGRAQGEPGLRLALEPGKTIRLQVSLDDDATWNDVATADALGECESYLKQSGRYLTVSVLPMTDASWEANLPVSLDGSGPPPGQIVVSLNGSDAVLVYTDQGLAEGCMAVTGQFRQWSVLPALMRFAIAGSVVLAPQIRPAEFQSDPNVFLSGYAPDAGGSISGTVIVDSLNSAHVEMTLAAAPDATGYALRSCFLSTVDAEFPPVQILPSSNPSYIDYFCLMASWLHWWDQTSGTVRHRGEVWLSNQNNEFAPGTGAALGVRAATLFTSAGRSTGSAGAVFVGGAAYEPELTGWTGMEDGGQEWIQQGMLKFFKLSLSDKLVHTEPDTAISCGFQLPYDYQPMYYAYGQQVYRLGIPDALWDFPVLRRNQADPGYYLDGGTTRQPVHQFPPDMTLGSAMDHIRAAGAEYDPATNTPLPMVQGTDALGNMLFFGLPVGVVSLLSDPSLTLSQVPAVIPSITFSAVPAFTGGGDAILNEFVQTWRSRSSLRRVRTPVVMVGLDPATGSAVFGVAYNEKLGGGRYADKDAPGYIGVDKPLYIVSRLYTSTAVAQLAADNASVQLAAPAIDVEGQVHVQPGLQPLTVVAVNDFTSQGTTADVGYFVTRVQGLIDNRSEQFHEETVLSGRILGLSA